MDESPETGTGDDREVEEPTTYREERRARELLMGWKWEIKEREKLTMTPGFLA